ncbi:hypothetical protein [Streptomyces melanogenes]|uniref:hypothetical protein n=1 Tax=Streptomyces melanogenes TaxID=67326 RepID=UPI0037B859D5
MSYQLTAVIAESGLLTSAAATFPSARTAPLPQGLALLPMTETLFNELTKENEASHPAFWRLPATLDLALAEWSKAGPVAYVESEYFGGLGEENSAVWRAGRLALGPLHQLEFEPVPAEGSPAVRALRELGVQPGDSFDEFTALGLDRHRHSEDWV